NAGLIFSTERTKTARIAPWSKFGQVDRFFTGRVESTSSLPCAPRRNRPQPTATASACLGGVCADPICHRLPPVATTGLHEGSIRRCLFWLLRPAGMATPVATVGIHKAPRRENRRRKRCGLGQRALPFPP